MATQVSRAQVLAYRVRVQGLDRDDGGSLDDTEILDMGVQDTGPDGALWALATRGVDTSGVADEDLSTVWTLRGAPHVYRRSDLPSVAAATAPFSDADAGKRIYNASKPLKSAGIGNLEALDTVAAALRAIVTRPTVKGEVSTRLTARLDPPYLHFCRPCNATHAYEMPFRLGALRAGLELQPRTSPPVLQRIKGFRAARTPESRHDVVRAYLHLLGPATPQLVAAYLDAPVTDIRAHWPEDVVDVLLDGEPRVVLADDESVLAGSEPTAVTRLLGPYDLLMQAQDRGLLVSDRQHAKALWPVLGRPGVVLHRDDVTGSWRPRQSGGKLTVAATLWGPRRSRETVRSAVEEQSERLAAFRQVSLARVHVED